MSITRTKKSENCVHCKKLLFGRKDKVFCSSNCKNHHHKEVREELNYLDSIKNRRIKRNCIILEGLLSKGVYSLKINRDALFQHGFDIDSSRKTIWKNGKRILYIGPFTFTLLKNGIIYIKRLKLTVLKKFSLIRRWRVEFLWKIEGENEFQDKNELNLLSVNTEIITAIAFVLKGFKVNPNLNTPPPT